MDPVSVFLTSIIIMDLSIIIIIRISTEKLLAQSVLLADLSNLALLQAFLIIQLRIKDMEDSTQILATLHHLKTYKKTMEIKACQYHEKASTIFNNQHSNLD